MHLSSENIFIFYVFYTFYSNDVRPTGIREFHCRFWIDSGEKYLKYCHCNCVTPSIDVIDVKILEYIK